ncbi:MAG: PA2778 family cysteine peptidase [Candidatus Rokuibacteriota bacterium]
MPFFAQAENQCGPASLAMVLSWLGNGEGHGDLVRQVYSSARQGSLATDMTAAVRRHGLVAYPVSTLADVVAEVAGGHPVIVLQDFGTSAWPRGHYAVVVGYDLAREQIILRSGPKRRVVSSFARFERTWAPSGHWGLLVLPPRRLPATTTEQTWLQAVVGLERAQQWRAALEAYEAAYERWPRSLGGLIGLGNSRYAVNDLAGAEHAFQLATQAHPKAAAAFHNLAHVLLESGRHEDARTAARRAAELADASESADASCDACVTPPRLCRTQCEIPNGLEGRQR